jgi:hypothetical protein
MNSVTSTPKRQYPVEKIFMLSSEFCDCYMKSTTSKFMLNAMHIEELAVSSQNDSALYEEDDPDTIRVEPRGARERTRQERGLDRDEQIERFPTQTADVTVKTCAASENVL